MLCILSWDMAEEVPAHGEGPQVGSSPLLGEVSAGAGCADGLALKLLSATALQATGTSGRTVRVTGGPMCSVSVTLVGAVLKPKRARAL